MWVSSVFIFWQPLRMCLFFPEFILATFLLSRLTVYPEIPSFRRQVCLPPTLIIPSLYLFLSLLLFLTFSLSLPPPTSLCSDNFLKFFCHCCHCYYYWRLIFNIIIWRFISFTNWYVSWGQGSHNHLYIPTTHLVLSFNKYLLNKLLVVLFPNTKQNWISHFVFMHIPQLSVFLNHGSDNPQSWIKE